MQKPAKASTFQRLELANGLLCEHEDEHFRTLVFGFTENETLDLPPQYTHFGMVVHGQIRLTHESRTRLLEAGDFFSVRGPARIDSRGAGAISSALSYYGLNLFGGPLEERGRLRYIDGCSDSLLVPPVRRGDPCLNHLHFPPGVTQTPHNHPSVRTGIIYRGAGECITTDAEPIALRPLDVFVIPTNGIHSFNTTVDSMDVIAFHPDSDVGMTDDDHPMINRTIVDGVSARFLATIRTTS